MTPEEKLAAAFQAALLLPADTDLNHLTYHDIPQWDSMGHMQLVAQLEKSFDVMLETDDVLNMSSYQKAREILSRHGVEFK